MITVTSGATGDLPMTQKICHFFLADTVDEVIVNTIVSSERAARSN